MVWIDVQISIVLLRGETFIVQVRNSITYIYQKDNIELGPREVKCSTVDTYISMDSDSSMDDYIVGFDKFLVDVGFTEEEIEGRLGATVPWDEIQELSEPEVVDITNPT